MVDGFTEVLCNYVSAYHDAAVSGGIGFGCAGVEIFNLGTGSGSSVLEVIKAFQTASGQEIPYVIEERRAGDIAQNFADATKAEKILGWKAEKTLEDMVRDSWNWQSKNPEGLEG